MENINTKLGKKIRELRQKKNLSQEELADLSGFHRTYIGMVERAEKNITLKNLEKLADALGIDIKELLS